MRNSMRRCVLYPGPLPFLLLLLLPNGTVEDPLATLQSRISHCFMLSICDVFVIAAPAGNRGVAKTGLAPPTNHWAR